MKIKRGAIYLDPRTRQFFQARLEYPAGWLCGRLRVYHQDAADSAGKETPLSDDYLSLCQEITFIDEVPGIVYDGYGWRMEDAEPAPKLRQISPEELRAILHRLQQSITGLLVDGTEKGPLSHEEIMLDLRMLDEDLASILREQEEIHAE